MDHLPPAADPYSPILVPYIGESDYDKLDFAGYPRRSKIDIDLLLAGDFQGFSSQKLAAFLQTWLFFGLIHEILSMDIKTKEFIRTDKSGHMWITTENLPGYLQAFRRKVLEVKAGPNGLAISQRRLEQIHKSFVLSCTTFQGFETFENRHGVPNPIPPEVGLGIHVLAITLEVATSEICAEKYRETPWAKERTWVSIINSFLRDRMVGQGWCPSVVEQIRGNALNQYYASLLGPPKRGLNHGLCSRYNPKCIAKTMVEGGYVIRHQKEGCECSILKVDSEGLARVIRSGEIPVLHLRENTGVPRLEVVSATSGQELEYTAISHVWSDGWGNPTENSLPFCRVQELIRLISATYSMPDFDIQTDEGRWQRRKLLPHSDRVCFWMDTLCVPRSPSEVYKEAINKMRDVYANAERVLVLDAELMASTAECSYEEINMRILCSTWIRRLWTIQEAVLAKRLVFQFKERAQMTMNGSLLWHAKQADLKVNYYNSVGWDTSTPFGLYDFDTGFGRIPFIWKILLVHRSVTFSSDEPICGAILMDFDLKELTKGEPEGEDVQDSIQHYRMRKFWSMHGDHVPVAVLFVAGPRLKEEGYSWAPASFIMCNRAGASISKMASINPIGGLRVKFAPYSAFHLSSPQAPTPSVVPCILAGQKYFIGSPKDVTNPLLEGLHLENLELVVIIEMVPTIGLDGRRYFDGSRCALVSITERVDGTIRAEYIRLITVIRYGTSYHKLRTIPWSKEEAEEAERIPCTGNFFDSEQEWHFH